MYDLTLTPEQIEFRDTVRDFAEREIKPVATHSSRLQPLRPPFPADLLAKASPLGLRTLMLPESAGGAGADTLTACMVMEELAAGEVNVAAVMAHTALLAGVLLDACSDVQRARFMPLFAGDDACHLACAGASLDGPGWLYHRTRTQAPMPLRAVRSGDDWLINGDAGFVANAPLAGLWLVHTGQGLFVLPRDAPGLSWRAPGTSGEQGLPWFTGSGAEVSFKDCAVPGADCLTAPLDMERSLRRGNVLMAAVNLGLGRAAFEAAIAYAQLRVQGARPIIQHQAIGTKLAGVAMQLEAARNLIWKAAWALDHPGAADSVGTLPLDAVARAFTAEHIHTAVENATECFGAMGVMRDMPMQKYVHDAMIFLHSGRSGMVDLFEVGESVAGFSAPVAAGSVA